MFGKGGNGQDIVSMTDREKMRRLAPLRHVEAYWHGLCASDAVPLRSQIDPRGMQDALENAFLMERIAPTMAKIRVAGTHLNDLMGMQIAGMPLSSLIAPQDRDRFGEAVARMFADPAIVRIDLAGEGGFGKPALEANMVLLPLRSDFGDQTRALGALVSHGRIGRTPRRFTVRHVEVIPALGAEREVTQTHRDTDAPLPAPALQEDPARYVPRAAPATSPARDEPALTTKGHLRLVVRND
ncbi:PAS domain-containing protein [Maliponia aquimaris]|uniref:PAS domain protein n=1 Tax=Maliponia aquimaris TaxID=1673631 RepID=A0A238JYV1_9RHOB|nr:PAS domain-containing protein [Maliponia aquimaris]SMX35683.1 PAS domain protein [Maliponia aquimaris]